MGVCARRPDRLAEVLDRCRVHTPASVALTVDLADLGRLDSFVGRVQTELGNPEVVVLNAGIPKRRRVEALSDDEITAVMAINYSSPALLTRRLLPHLRAEGGRLVGIGSVAARVTPPGEAAYSASKAALVAFLECLAIEVWNEPMSVHVIHPGLIDTELFNIPNNDPLLADDMEKLAPSAVADAVVAACTEGGYERYVPEWFSDIATGKLANMDGFLAGAAAYEAERLAARAEGG